MLKLPTILNGSKICRAFSMRFKATPNHVSAFMDTANGAVLAHGEYHRHFDGHSSVERHKYSLDICVTVKEKKFKNRVMLSLPTILNGSKICRALSMRFKATPHHVSAFMDTTNGAVLAHGGYHRLLGGHSLVDLKLWEQFHLSYPKELLKDFITPFGLPLPGVETLVKKEILSPHFAQSYLTLNVFQTLLISVALIDSYKTFRKKNKKKTLKSSLIKAFSKSTIGLLGQNPLLLGLGITDFFLIRNELKEAIDENLLNFIGLDFGELNKWPAA